MDRRDFLKFGLAGSMASAMPGTVQAANRNPLRPCHKRKPYNVIWVLMDTLRAKNVSCYGYDRPTTPALDHLASRGVIFEQNFAQAPHTLLSVPSYFTSRRYPCMWMGLDDPFYLFKTPPPDEKPASLIFEENGYHTCLINTQPWISEKSRFFKSFKEAYFLSYTIEGNLNTGAADFNFLVNKSIEWLDSPAARQPFMLYIHGMEPHVPHDLPDEYRRWVPSDYPEEKRAGGYPPKASPMLKADQDYFRGLYDGSIRMADDHFGRLLDKLETCGLMEDTIIVFHSDHGEALGEDGFTVQHPNECFTDELLHVPLVMAGPGLPAGKRVSALTENMDILPTLVDMLNLKTDACLEGKSLRKLAHGRGKKRIHDWIFAKNTGYEKDLDVLYHNMILRTPEWTYYSSPTCSQQELRKTPFTLTENRENLLKVHLEALPPLRRILDEEIQPLAKAWRELPMTSLEPIVLSLGPAVAEPESAFINNRDVLKDDKWSVATADVMGLPWEETLPPITFRFRIPDGRYRVSMQVMTARNKWGYAGSAFLYRCNGDSEFRLIRSDLETLGELDGRWEFLLLGEYKVSGQEFAITLKAGDDKWWASARRLLFEPAGTAESGSEPVIEKEDEKLDQLKALGYI